MNKNDKIRYDKKMLRIVRAIALILTAIVLISLSVTSLKAEDIPIFLADIIGPMLVAGVFSFYTAVIFWVIYIDGYIYLKSLEKAGFEPIEDARVYGRRLSSVPRRVDKISDESKRYRPSVALSIINGLIALTIWIVDINYVLCWHGALEIGFMVTLLAVVGVCWLIIAIKYYKESDNAKYKNYFDEDSNKKTRGTISNGIAGIVVFGFISFIVVIQVFTMTKYVAASRLAADKEWIRATMNQAASIIEDNIDSKDDKWPESYEMLRQGVDFFEASWPDDLFAEKLLEQMDIQVDSIGDIKQYLRVSDAHVYVTLTDNMELDVDYSYKWQYGVTVTPDGPWLHITTNNTMK